MKQVDEGSIPSPATKNLATEPSIYDIIKMWLNEQRKVGKFPGWTIYHKGGVVYLFHEDVLIEYANKTKTKTESYLIAIENLKATRDKESIALADPDFFTKFEQLIIKATLEVEQLMRL